MSMHGTPSTSVSDAARALVKAALGDSPVIVVDDLKGDATKGEPVTNGTFAVLDEKHPTFGDVVRNRVVKLGDNVVYGPILVTSADKLTHAKAENVLRSFATMGGWPVRPAREKQGKPDGLDESAPVSTAQRIDEVVASFPPVFRLRAFPGDLFCILRAACYWSNGPVLYTGRLVEGDWLAFAKGSPEELRREVQPCEPGDNARLVEYHLEQMDAWRSGAKATPGQPAEGQRYALSMRENIKRHAAALRELGHPVDDVGNPLA